MAKKSMKQYRLESTKENGKLAAVCCFRCLGQYGDGAVDGDTFKGCIMDSTDDKWVGYQMQGRQTKRCMRCLSQGQDCLALPLSFKDQAIALRALVQTIVSRETTDDERKAAKEKLSADAGAMSAAITDLHCPLAAHLSLHSGAIEPEDDHQSGVKVSGRDRSKAGVLKKEMARKRAVEGSDSESELPTPKKAKFGMVAVELTKEEQKAKDREVAAEAAKKAIAPAKKSRTRSGRK